MAAAAAGAGATAAEPPAAALAPPRYREAILEEPWRGGCEPVEDMPARQVPDEWIVEGKLPDGLKGTIYRNGAGRLRVGPDAQYGHWFDGDGYVGALFLDGSGNARVCGRYVRTPRFEAQERHGPGGFARRGAWTSAAGGLLGNVMRSPTTAANTSVAYTGGRLLALAEGGLPFELDPETLETIGEYKPQDWPLSGVGPYYSAHGKVVGSTGEVVNFGLAFLPLALHVFTQDPATGAVLKKGSVALEHLTFVHDFAITERHAIFVLPPWVSRGGSLAWAMLGTTNIGGTFEWRPELGTRVLVFDLEGMRLLVDRTVPAAWSFYHHVNAWEDTAEGKIRLHTLLHNGPREPVESNFADLYAARFSAATRCSPAELSVDLATGDVEGPRPVPRASAESYSCEFPAVHPRAVGRRHRLAFLNVAAPEAATWLNAVQRLDLATGQATTRSFGEQQFAGEPILIPKPGRAGAEEAAAYVSAFVYDSGRHRTSLLLLDGEQDLATVCRIDLPCHWPYFFHGTWVPAAEEG